ncbi:MAG TPA: hypothetical protein PKD90_12700, partial [Phnomibacter sp.]|nr:hypothetical protein [Phnomibacter sp.]
ILSVDLPMQDTPGKLQTTILGPALRWDALRWLPLPASGSFDAAKDSARVLIMGSNNKQEWDTIKLVNKTQLWYPFTGADTIKASDYQYLKLELLTDDPLQGTPFPLDYLRVNYLPAPEGALSSNDYFEWPKLPNNAYKDTFNNTVPDTIKLGIAFKNISSATFTDSLKVQAFMEDETGNRQVLNVGNIKPLAGGDTAHINLAALVDGWPVGSYKLYLAVNPGLQVPEQDFANNFLYRSLYITDVLATPTNVKTFNGTGQWSDASKWTPAGVPACTDKVFINGNCTVDVTDAVADSLTINAGARLLLQPNTQLRLGCQTNGGGNKLLKVLGALELQGGTLFINGGLFFANASSFIQTDGEIWIDPNDGNAATSLQLDEAATDGTMPPAVLAFGGTQTTTDHWLQPLQTFTLQATGGKIVIIDPPQSETGYAMSLAALNNLELHFGTGHTLQIGSSTETSPHNSLGMGFRIVSISTGLPQLFALGNMAVQTGDAAGRLCNITWPAEQQFLILGQIQVAENATLQVGAGTTLVQGQQ